MADKRFAGLNGLSAVFGQIKAAIAEKQDKINGKSLSTNDYDNTEKALNAQNASDIAALNDAVDDINEKMDGDATTYPYADVITVSDAIPANLADCSVKVEPVQDLHGYDKPWVGGAGKNIFINSNQTYQNAEAQSNVFSDERILGTATGTYYLSFEYKVLTASGNSQSLFYGKYNGSRISGGNIGNWVDSTVSSDWISKSFTLNLGDNVINGIELFSNNALAVRNIMISATPITAFEPFENICPISGHTEAVVTQLDKNWFDYTKITVNSRVDITNGTIQTHEQLTQFKVSDYTEVLAQKTYILNFTYMSGADYGMAFYDENKAFLSGCKQRVNEGDTTFSFTTPSKCKYIRFTINDEIDPDDIQLELGTVCTKFEKFVTPKQYTLALGDTIYGGTVDFDSGVMTVDRAIIDLGSPNWTYETIYHRFVTGIANKKNTYAVRSEPFVCSQYQTISDGRPLSSVPDGSIYNDAYNINIFVTDSRYTNATEFKNAVTGQTLCYELATPFTVQLTPQQIQLLQGTNTLYASTGDISVSVNGVSGAIGAVQEQVNGLDAKVPDAPSTDGTYSLQVTVSSGTPIYSWVISS